MTRALGRIPNDPTRPRLRLRLAAAPTTVPDTVDHASRVNDWPMYSNDTVGDCVPAAAAHIVASLTTYGGGQTRVIADQGVLGAYAAVTGWDPTRPDTDQGTNMQDFLGWWRTTTAAEFGEHRIAAFASLDVQDTALLTQVLDQLGSVYVGMAFPQFAYAQLDAGQPWDVQDADATVLGGHCVNVVGRRPGQWQVVTWGRTQWVTDAFWSRYFEEAWAPLTADWLSAAGTTPTGLSLAGLGEQFTALTGQPSPFPDTPIDAPPAPPAADDPDTALADAARTWLAAKQL